MYGGVVGNRPRGVMVDGDGADTGGDVCVAVPKALLRIWGLAEAQPHQRRTP
jgi:hypothetical protein